LDEDAALADPAAGSEDADEEEEEEVWAVRVHAGKTGTT